MQHDEVIRCPLCGEEGPDRFHQDRYRDYYRCVNCRLVFVPPSQFLSREQEKARYDLHENSADDAGYVKFLAKLFDPVSARLAPGSHGLDFGSGPGPTLSLMFEKAGHTVDLYDPFYAPDATVFERQYDFITASEVLEHLHNPRGELDRLWGILKRGGWLGIMTKRARDAKAFKGWHYKDDDTHVIFFSDATFEWLGREWGVAPEFEGNDVVMFRKG